MPASASTRGSCATTFAEPARGGIAASDTPTATTASAAALPAPSASPVAIAIRAAIAPSVAINGAISSTAPLR